MQVTRRQFLLGASALAGAASVGSLGAVERPEVLAEDFLRGQQWTVAQFMTVRRQNRPALAFNRLPPMRAA